MSNNQVGGIGDLGPALMKPDPSFTSAARHDKDDVQFIQRVLTTAREHLDMAMSFVTEVSDAETIYRFVNGDAVRDFGFEAVQDPGAADESDSGPDTYCQRMLQGQLPNVIPSTKNEPLAQSLPSTQVIGSYVGVPILFANGTIFGTLCCMDQDEKPGLSEKDAGLLRVLAGLIGDRVEHYSTVWKERAVKEQRIDRALEDGAISIVVQPIVNMSTNTIVGVEALSRFQIQPKRAPDAWFREAVEVGCGVKLEIAAVRAALASVASVRDDIYLALNVSPATLMSGELAESLGSLPLERLVFELTEHAAVEDYAALQRAFRRLRSAGIRLAVDDAGAGYSSLRHILQMAPDIIKLDIALTKNIQSDPVRRSLASALVAFAADTGATITAEGVETSEERDALCQLGIGFGQGYFCGRPVPAHDLENLNHTAKTLAKAGRAD